MKLALIFGTRPQIIKCVPVIRESQKKKVDLTLINTGQHYDYWLSQIFLEEFRLSMPTYSLDVGSGSHAWQTGNVMMRVENTLKDARPSACIIPGDTNSAIGSALAAVKMKIPVIHLEAGLRSYEEFMPEEINRKVIDHVSQLLLAPTVSAKNNLLHEGIPHEKIALTGDTMYELVLMEASAISKAELPSQARDVTGYILLTLHREENTEDREKLKSILAAIRESNIPTIFPIHPRTKKRLNSYGMLGEASRIKNLFLIEPLGYHSMMKLIGNSLFVMTDSGGVQKEAFILKIPCITLRRSTEWTETTKNKANVLIKELNDSDAILAMINHIRKHRDQIVQTIRKSRNPFGDGNASTKILDELIKRYC